MDEDYARKLRAWLSAEPEAIPRRAEEEREWLREVPAPQPDPDRWTIRGRLPQEELKEEWVCPVIALPVPRASDENGCRMSSPDDRRSRNGLPRGEAAADEPGVGEAGELRPGRAAGEAASGQAGAGERRPWGRRVRGEAAADEPGELKPGRAPGEAATDQPRMSAAEARSRWNHPSNWHRRRRASEQWSDRDQPGSH